jgi:glycosyltransferase involved in cell wall biosynthesis
VLSDQWKKSLTPYAPGARWAVIHNSVNVPAEPHAAKEGPTTFLFLGNLGVRKGVLDLVEASRQLLGKGEDFRVKIAGNETEGGEVERLLRTVQQNGLSSHIEYLGVISGPDKDDAMRSADVIVLPSHAEGLPMALLEGMAYGLAVLSTNVGGIPELVSEGRDGLLVDPGDIDALAKAMHRLTADKVLAERMGRAARQKIVEKYSMSAMTAKLNQLYSSFGR